MILNAYKFYRVSFDNSNSSSAGAAFYITVNEFKIFDENNANILNGSSVTASGIYQSQTPNFAIDGNDSTYWESDSTSQNKWIQFELPTPKVAKYAWLKSITYPDEVPKDFKILGSNDGTNWFTIISVTNWSVPGVAKTDFIYFTKSIKGNSKLVTPLGNIVIEFYDWDSGTPLGKVQPDVNGDWVFHHTGSNKILIVHKGPVGFRPQADVRLS